MGILNYCLCYVCGCVCMFSNEINYAELESVMINNINHLRKLKKCQKLEEQLNSLSDSYILSVSTFMLRDIFSVVYTSPTK